MAEPLTVDYPIKDFGYSFSKPTPLVRSRMELGPLNGQFIDNIAIAKLKLLGGRYKLFCGVTYAPASGEKFSVYRWDRLEDEFVLLNNSMVRFEPLLNQIKKRPLGMLKQIELLRASAMDVIKPQGIVDEYCARFYDETGLKFEPRLT